MPETKDPLLGKAEEFSRELDKKATDQLKVLKKIKAMTKLAHDIGEDTGTIEKFLDIAETVLIDITKRVHPPAEKS